jgi:hypothetical protein
VSGVLCGEPMEERRRVPHRADRWCFRCRTVRAFQFVVRAPVGVSYYGPTPAVECGTCGASDGDLFPGRYREWEA